MGLHDRISIVARRDDQDDRPGGSGGRGQRGGRGGMTMQGGEANTGAGVGAAIGGAGGLLAAAGLFAVPGIGPILALGPLAAGLTGAAAGGLIGGLVDLGVPRERGEYYEGQVKQGRVLCTVEAGGRADEVRQVLERNGAREVEVH
jgi:hypothetical protein